MSSAAVVICALRVKTYNVIRKAEFANGVDPDEVAHTEPPYLDLLLLLCCCFTSTVTQSIGHLTRKSGVLGSIPGLATYFRFSFRFFKKGSCQLLAKVCARSTG